MEQLGHDIMMFIETSGFYAPLLFIIFHLLRPVFFLPVFILCIFGGLAFGTVTGSIYSLIGMTLSSMAFYGLFKAVPKLSYKLIQLKTKLIGKHTKLTAMQIALLRLIPFMHFQLLSLCMLEISEGFKDYMKLTVLSMIPISIFYTMLGGWIAHLSPAAILVFLILLILGVYICRRKVAIIKWDEFFGIGHRA